MAAIDAAGLAAALGITVAAADAKDDPGIVEAGRLLSIAGALVDAYLHSADDTACPVDVRNESLIRVAGHVMNRAGFGRVEGAVQISSTLKPPLAPMARAAVRQSGAAALLAPFVRRTA